MNKNCNTPVQNWFNNEINEYGEYSKLKSWALKNFKNSKVFIKKSEFKKRYGFFRRIGLSKNIKPSSITPALVQDFQKKISLVDFTKDEKLFLTRNFLNLYLSSDNLDSLSEDTLRHYKDFFNSCTFNFTHSFSDFSKKLSIWENSELSKDVTLLKFVSLQEDIDYKTIYEYKNTVFVQLLTERAFDKEHVMLNHCVNQYYDRSGKIDLNQELGKEKSIEIFSLRLKENIQKPIATVELHFEPKDNNIAIRQIKGHSNAFKGLYLYVNSFFNFLNHLSNKFNLPLSNESGGNLYHVGLMLKDSILKPNIDFFIENNYFNDLLNSFSVERKDFDAYVINYLKNLDPEDLYKHKETLKTLCKSFKGLVLEAINNKEIDPKLAFYINYVIHKNTLCQLNKSRIKYLKNLEFNEFLSIKVDPKLYKSKLYCDCLFNFLTKTSKSYLDKIKIVSNSLGVNGLYFYLRYLMLHPQGSNYKALTYILKTYEFDKKHSESLLHFFLENNDNSNTFISYALQILKKDVPINLDKVVLDIEKHNYPLPKLAEFLQTNEAKEHYLKILGN